MTKDVDKGTEKLEDMIEAVVTIRRKDSDKFEGHCNTGSSPRYPLGYHFMVCIENHFLIVVIGPNINKYLEFIF